MPNSFFYPPVQCLCGQTYQGNACPQCGLSIPESNSWFPANKKQLATFGGMSESDLFKCRMELLKSYISETQQLLKDAKKTLNSRENTFWLIYINHAGLEVRVPRPFLQLELDYIIILIDELFTIKGWAK